jgi:hypothetical protein
VPLSKIQGEVLRLLAAHRDPESYVGGGIPLNRNTNRFSADIDVFHDREERVAQAALNDEAVLQSGGYAVEWLRQFPTIYTAAVTKAEEGTRLEWVADSDFRFFPTVTDEVFGYVLHPIDLATNKIMAAAGRRELRDIVDLVTIHDTILPLGAVAWAAVEKSPGFTPEGLIAEVRRNSIYPKSEWTKLLTSEPLDPAETLHRLYRALKEAEAFVTRMPTDKVGLLFLKDGQVVQPDPNCLSDYQTHVARRRGQWPSSSEISSAMLERYRQTTDGS